MTANDEEIIGRARDSQAKRVTWTGAAINLVLALGKGSAGLHFGSRALVADAVDSFTDLFTDAITLTTYPLSRRPVDEDHPYGHGRIEALAAIGVASILVVAALLIAYRAVTSISTGDTRIPSWPALVVAAISLTTKEWLYRWTAKVARKLNSRVLMANAWNHRNDAFSSVAVLIGIAGALFIPGGGSLDAIASLVVVLFILRAALGIARGSISDLLDTAQDTKLLRKIINTANGIPGVLNAHRERSRRYGHLIYVDLDIEVDPEITVLEGHHLSHMVKEAVLERHQNIADIQIHVEPRGDHLMGEGSIRLR